jgi:lipopolysaccharide/colanic/teichoic acid biosynthesis glycosyltransferase
VNELLGLRNMSRDGGSPTFPRRYTSSRITSEAVPLREISRSIRVRGLARFPAGRVSVQNVGRVWPGKRAFDVALTLLMVPVAALIVGIAAILILVTCGRPVFFLQTRTGLNGRIFWMYKLRTLVNGSGNCQPTIVGDARVTTLGRILRRYRIDELPQLYNVLRGDMSLIGPRPEQPHLVATYRQVIPKFDERHLVKPGLTGIAQVRYQYASNLRETKRKIRYDLFYVRRASFALDAYIALRTVVVILKGTGAR